MKTLLLFLTPILFLSAEQYNHGPIQPKSIKVENVPEKQDPKASKKDTRATQLLRTQIEHKLKNSYHNANVTVQVSHNTVILTGSVRNTADKERIESDILAIKGVREVDNQLIIIGTPN